MRGAFRFLEDLNSAWTCPKVKSCLEQTEGYRFLLLVSLTAGLDRWLRAVEAGWNKSAPPRMCQTATGEVPLNFQVLKLSFSSFSWPTEPSSSAQGIMGKVCQFSRIWHLWVILSQGLFFKGPPERLAWRLMLTLTLTVWPFFGLNCKHTWWNLLAKLSLSLEF